jgi:predicted helicase
VPSLNLKPNHKSIREYYTALVQFSLVHATHEGAVRAAFGTLLHTCAQQHKWTLVGEFEIRRKSKLLRVDGAIVDHWSLTHGLWEAKDEEDDLAIEAKRKIDLGYPTDNIIFQAPDRAIIYQGGKRLLDEKLKEPNVLVNVLKEFFRYEPPQYDEWGKAVADFKIRIPDLARALDNLISSELTYPHFKPAFDRFAQVCRASIDPRLTNDAVKRMLVQHVLTERLYRNVFKNSDFVRRNAIAAAIELVIDKLTQRSFNREKFLGGLDPFYKAIEATAATITEFSEKQHFLNKVYESFFQGFDEKTADTHGIVYTPQPIVRFMVNSIDEILKNEFGTSLGNEGVHILDPFVGTGNFLLSVMRQIPKTRLPHKYAHELHANEVMLLPYYIASMNIEHEYAELAGEYKPFEGLCLVDTFELSEDAQREGAPLTEENTKRVAAQRAAPITVIVGNPPYNAGQESENDNNKNRKYPVVDGRVRETYGAMSEARKTKYGDPYVKALRWASDRVGPNGIVALVTNSSYVQKVSFDGVRKCLAAEFDRIDVVDLGGDIRLNPEISGTTHNVFGIPNGVAIVFLRRGGKA